MRIKVKEMRSRMGKEMTQKELAEKSGVSLCTIAYLESGRQKSASLEIVSKLAQAFGVSIEDMIYREN